MIGKKVALVFCTLFIILGINGKETIQSQSENKTLVIDSGRITEINDERTTAIGAIQNYRDKSTIDRNKVLSCANVSTFRLIPVRRRIIFFIKLV